MAARAEFHSGGPRLLTPLPPGGAAFAEGENQPINLPTASNAGRDAKETLLKKAKPRYMSLCSPRRGRPRPTAGELTPI